MEHVELIEPGCLRRLGRHIVERSPNKILLVTGIRSFELSGAASKIEQALQGLKYQRLVQHSLLVKAEDTDQVTADVRVYQPDLIVAVGGGAVIDSAKILCTLVRNQLSARDLPETDISSLDNVPLVAVPTTAGTGTEVTSFAAMYRGGRKYSIAAPALKPCIALVDAELTFSLPPYDTACTGFDALCQAIESHWSKRSTAESRQYSSEAMKLASRNLVESVKTGAHAARIEMAKAAHLSGKAINITGTTGPHAFSYGLTYEFEIPHGHAVAIGMRQFFRYNCAFDQYASDEQDSMMRTKTRLDEITSCLGLRSCEEGADFISGMMRQIGLSYILADLGIREDKVRELCEKVDPIRLSNNPRFVPRDQYPNFFF